jgi:hypothetical protein
MNPDIIPAHRHSIRHRDEVLRSSVCGCFYCCQTFAPATINEWTDICEGLGQTALCPHCCVDSIIGSESGYDLTSEFLEAMHDHWFGDA